MSSKEASGVKKDKSFNGSKAKYSPNPSVPDKKEVKLRRKESEKLKQASDTSTRKSVLGRIFRSFVDSDDSRKVNASADTKKKKGTRDAGENFGSDLDLPEHGVILRKTQTLDKTQDVHPSARLRASTLSTQGSGRSNRNRWSSYDIHGNFMEGFLPPLARQLETLTLGHRSQSDETLNTPVATDQQNVPRLTGNFENAKHSTSTTKQPDVMRRHAQLLKTIQEQNVSKGTRSEHQGGQSGNAWLQSGDAVTNGQRNSLDVSELKDANQKLHVPKSLDSDGAVAADASKSSGSKNSVSLALLQEKNKEIEKALADKRRILSNLFKTPEVDMECLIERDMELSEDLTVRKMILISLLQSDQLTSAINSSLVPHKKVSAADKEFLNQKDVKSHTEQTMDKPLYFQSLQSTTMRLYQNVKLLTAMLSKEVSERDCIMKELEETQNRLKKKTTDRSLLETNQTKELDTNVIQQRVDNDANLELKISTEILEPNTEQLNREQELKLDVPDTFLIAEPEPVNDSVALAESVTVEIGSKVDSVNEAVQHNSEDDGTEVKQLLTSEEDLERNKNHLCDDDSALMVPCVDDLVNMNDCVQLDSDKEAEGSVFGSRNKEDFLSCLKTESVSLSSAIQEANQFKSEADKTSNSTIPMLEISDSDLQFQQGSSCDFTHEIQDEGTINVSQSLDDRDFQNLQSIPEDNNKSSVCDVKHEVVFNDNSKEIILSNVQISPEHSVDKDDDLCLDAESDTQSNAEDDSLSNVKIDIHSEQDVVSKSVMEGAACFYAKDETEESTLEAGVQSDVDSTVCGLEDHSDSALNCVLPAVHIVSDEDSSIIDPNLVLYEPVEQKSPCLSDDHVTSFDVNDDLVEHSVDPSRIAVDKEEEEEEIEQCFTNESSALDRIAKDDVEEDLNSESCSASDSELKYEVVNEAVQLEDVASLFGSESETNLLLNMGEDLMIFDEGNLLKNRTEADFGLHDTAIAEEEIAESGFSTGGLITENSNLDNIRENKAQSQSNKESLFVGVSTDQNGNQDVGQSSMLLFKNQSDDCNENEVVNSSGSTDISEISDLSNCGVREVDVLGE